MQFLYLILLTTATFCYDPEVLNYPEIFKAKYKILEKIKNNAYLNPVPNNYNDYLLELDFSGDFIFDIVPIDKWKQETKFLTLLPDSEDDRKQLAINLDGTFFVPDFCFYDNSTNHRPEFYVNQYMFFCPQTITTSKGEFIMYYFIKGMTVAIPRKTSGNVKVCTTTNSIFKKCAEYGIGDAIKATALAYTYSKIKEKADAYD